MRMLFISYIVVCVCTLDIVAFVHPMELSNCLVPGEVYIGYIIHNL